MRFIGRVHGHTTTDKTSPPGWVTFYDPIVTFLTLGRANRMRQATLDLAGIKAGDHVLDIGCGTGDLAIEAQKRVGAEGEVVGIDVAPAMIAQATRKTAKQHRDIVFQIGSIEHIPYPDDSFDVILSSMMIHHLTDAQKKKGMVELWRVLKPNGRFVAIDLDQSRRSLITMVHGYDWLPKEDFVRQRLPALLREAGFTAVTTGKHRFKQLSYAIGEKG